MVKARLEPRLGRGNGLVRASQRTSRRRKKGSKGWRESWPCVVKSSREARRLG